MFVHIDALYMSIQKLLFILLCTLFSYACNQQDLPASKQDEPLAYETITMVRTYQDCASDSPGCTYIRFSFPQFTNSSGSIHDSLSAFIKQQFVDSAAFIYDPDSLQQRFLKEYEQTKNEIEYYDQTWTLDRIVEVLHQNAKWITLELNDYGYTGGAHPNGYIEYVMFDKADGHRLTLADFFDETGIQKLTVLGEKEFRKVRAINPNMQLSDAGFDFNNDRFSLSPNFYINDEGIVFQYNAYEVGPYVLGETTITLPASQFMKWLKKQS